MRPLVISRMLATTALESTPPERNTPSGTSLSRRSRTASRRWPRTSAAVSPTDGGGVVAGAPAGSRQ